MGLYKTITLRQNTKVLIWSIEESEEELQKGIVITDYCRERMGRMKSELHRRGFLSIRHLLKEAGYTTHQLYYDEQGKPHLTDGKFISITHSFGYCGIIISDIPVGIDIEKQREKIRLIAHKFVDYEFSYLTEDEIRRLTLVWCSKESLYKVFATPGLSFKDHTKIIPFDLEDSKTTGWVFYESRLSRYDLEFLEFDGFSCAWALHTN
ncbi:4'-phosphopantetheinyl transferase family protein [Robertkochia aurantiaca]|uniref:4'-phosphopantetheinyl transferase family protein n=1 Tax=Robertkochia aurantiaca TaxID=2873700 RepID=UPI001CC96DD5|nr:4'-phosphopantetheinyl transferase family protein [Robertkochia sp. 3YJGBD-33]